MSKKSTHNYIFKSALSFLLYLLVLKIKGMKASNEEFFSN